jgi:hypothetical protein
MEVHKGIYWYSTDPHSSANLVAIPVQRVREIQAMNRKGVKPERILELDKSLSAEPVSEDLLKNNSLTRFDPEPKKSQPQKRFHRKKNRRPNDRKNRQV